MSVCGCVCLSPVKKTSPSIGEVFSTGHRKKEEKKKKKNYPLFVDKGEVTHTHTHPTPNLGGCEEDLSNGRRCLLHRGQTDIQTDGHCDTMTELAQWADSVKILTI